MTTTTAYLADLERELRGLPAPLASDILAGVREELRGLDDAAAAERIAVLGDPAAIAAAARAEAPPRREDAPWYRVLTILLIAVGGFVVPVVGWAVGVGMLWYSRTWVLRDKLVGTLVVPVGALLALGIAVLVPVSAEAHEINPLAPNNAHLGLVAAVFVLPIVSAVYLAVRSRRLTPVEADAAD